ncbi:MAG: hypothetical protein AAGG61_00025 [Methanothrix soehngenii]|jgi:hypothetical protein|uniref:hypothetical protein n=1 Tax=Methanothrix soehngenii TaxID=2223 RepID=UPI003142D87B
MSEVGEMDDAEIRARGLEALYRALRPARAHKFLAMFHREPTDYVEISRRLYEGQSIEEIFDRAKKERSSQKL